MKKHFFSMATSLLLLAGFSSSAQSDDTQKKVDEVRLKVQAAQDKLNADDLKNDQINNLNSDYGEIVIKRKNTDKDEKVTVEIKNDKVFVNGQPIDVFVNDAVSVTIRNPLQYNLIAPGSPFRFPGSTWSLEDGNMYNGRPGPQAFLGLMTDASAEGAKVISVTDNSAASKAGLQKDDIVTKVNGKPVADHKQLSEAIAALKPADKVEITYKRDGKENKTTAILGKRLSSKMRVTGRYLNPDAPEAPEPPELPEGIDVPAPPMPPMEFNFDDFGHAFNMDSRPRLGIKAQDTEDGKGVKVIGVDDESAAEKAGLKKDDIITSFDGKKVSTSGELAEAARVSKDKSSVKIQYKRDGKTQDTEIKVPRKLRTANL